MNEFVITSLQIDLKNSSNNRERLLKEIRLACARYPFTSMIIFGELASHGTSIDSAKYFEESVAAYCQIAKELDIWLVPGSLFEPVGDNNEAYNTTPIINPNGEVIKKYRKIFPWLPFESGTIPGDDFVTFDIENVGRFGICICYDHMFPELIRAMIWDGAEVILHPTATYSTDRPAEHIVARAHAITNQCYFFDINNGGHLSLGQSIVVGPEGEVVYQSPGTEYTIMPVAVDFGRIRAIRKNGTCHVSQILKSFRDSDVKYPQHGNLSLTESKHLNKLGKIGFDD